MIRRPHTDTPTHDAEPLFDLNAYPLGLRFVIVSLRLAVAVRLGRAEAPVLLIEGMRALGWAGGETVIFRLLERVFAVWPRVFMVRPSVCSGFTADEWIVLRAISALASEADGDSAQRILREHGCAGPVDELVAAFAQTLAAIDRRLARARGSNRLH
jgi:hypothetical protein